MKGKTIKGLIKHRTARQKLTKRLDDLLHEIVVLRDKACVICGSTQNLQAGHLKWFLDTFGKQAYDDLYTEAHKPAVPIKAWQLKETYEQLQVVKRSLE